MAGKFNSESVSISTGTARSLAILPMRAALIAAAGILPGSIGTMIAQNVVFFPAWMGFAAPVINAMGFSVLPG